ncbi:unnamed protein product [Candida parapsilosis]
MKDNEIEKLNLPGNKYEEPFEVKVFKTGISESRAYWFVRIKRVFSKPEVAWSNIPRVSHQFNLGVLPMVSCDSSKLAALRFTSNSVLKRIVASSCDLKSLDFDLRQLVEEVDLLKNELFNLYEQVCHLEHLRVLNLADNQIANVEFEFLQNSLGVLDLSSNK